MIARAFVTHEAMLERFLLALDFHSHDERRTDYVANFHEVERDYFVCPETPIDLPE